MLLLLFEQLVTRRREWKQGLQKGEGRIEPTEQPTPDKRLIRLVSSVPAGAQCFSHRVRGRMVRLPFETVECELNWPFYMTFLELENVRDKQRTMLPKKTISSTVGG